MEHASRVAATPVFLPFAAALLPIVLIYSANTSSASPALLVLPIAVTFTVAGILWLVLRPVLRDRHKIAIAIALFYFWLFSFASYAYLVDRLSVVGLALPLRYLLLSWGIIYLLLLILIVNSSATSLVLLTRLLNGAMLAALVVSAFSVARAYLPYSGPTPIDPVLSVGASASASQPDIYYIILDAYARQDVLATLYDYDNSEFLQALQRMGFYIAEGSRANYSLTHLSLASSLNMRHLHDLVGANDDISWASTVVIDLLQKNQVLRFLKDRRYTFVSFATGFYPTEMPQADIYLAPPVNLTDFHAALFRQTPLSVAWNALPRSPYDLHRERVLFVLDRLADLPQDPHPLFVFAHLVSPHRPFVFGPYGEPLAEAKAFTLEDAVGDFSHAEYVRRYRDQVAFLSRRLLLTLEAILARSSAPPIIIVQSDHGPPSLTDWEHPAKTNFQERMAILNALYLPGEGAKRLYRDMSPVNTFRIILQHYYGATMTLAPDTSYFSTPQDPHNFMDVTLRLDQ